MCCYGGVAGEGGGLGGGRKEGGTGEWTSLKTLVKSLCQVGLSVVIKTFIVWSMFFTLDGHKLGLGQEYSSQPERSCNSCYVRVAVASFVLIGSADPRVGLTSFLDLI